MDNKLVRIREAARRLGVSHSTIVRQMQSGQIPNRGSPGRPLVSVEEVLRAREESVNFFKSGNWAGLLAGERDTPPKAAPPAPDPAPDPSEPPQDVPFERGLPALDDGPSLKDARMLREAYQAKTAKLDYEVKVKELVSAQGVEREVMDAGRALRDGLLQFRNKLAADFGPEIAGRFDQEVRELLTAFADSFGAEPDSFGENQGGEHDPVGGPDEASDDVEGE